MRDYSPGRIAVLDFVRGSAEWVAAKAAASEILEDELQADRAVDALARRVLLAVLPDEGMSKQEPERIARHLALELIGKPVEYRGEIQLDGLVVWRAPVEIRCGSTELILRPVVAADLEIASSDSLRTRDVPHPSAMLSMRLLAARSNAFDTELERIVAGLRLFAVGSVAVSSYSLDTDSVMGLGWGMVRHSGSRAAMELYVIEEAHAQQLAAFLNRIVPVLPASCGDRPSRGADSYWHIAYIRYSDALFEPYSYEQRIASAIMALEALLLGDDDMQELAFKLSMRVARLLSHFGDDAQALQDCIQLAYRIRSRHVHGGAATARDNRRVMRTHGGKREFVHVVLDAVRRVLLISLLLRDKKESLIASIDSALLGGTFPGTRVHDDLDAIGGLVLPCALPENSPASPDPAPGDDVDRPT